ncbi:MAG TPA: hypothetical protein VL122_09285 [Nitrospirota bacterium]|nr:hypothetical protein [Nitrospirota bacterium]
MPELVMVSSVEKMENLKAYLVELFNQQRYSEITQAIGMHSLLIDPQHTMNDQARLYHHVLNMLKNRISKAKGKSYGSWYTGFPKVLDQIMTANQIVTDKTAAEALASHRAGYGPFKSVDDFFFWALDDRRLPLEQIVKYIEQTAAMTAC